MSPVPPAESRARAAELEAARTRLKTGRNAPCPCGSGRKYKQCCLEDDADFVRRYSGARVAGRARSEVDQDDGGAAGHGLSPDVRERPEDEPERSPEDRHIEALWDEIESLEHPSATQLDRFVDGLLALPAEKTDWNELLHFLGGCGHPDLTGVFRRIADAVPASSETGMAFFYWAAVEALAPWGRSEMLPEIAARFRRLDGASYDMDALVHVMDCLLAEGLEAETLELAEHFLPIVRADDGLMGFALPEHCALIFELRAGRHLRSGPGAQCTPEFLALELRRDMEDEIDEELAERAAAGIAGRAPPPAWTRAAFELPEAQAPAWPATLRLLMVLLELAREAWHIDGRPPGCAFRGLRLLSHTLDERRARARKSTVPGNLLDSVRTAGMEERVVRACRDLLGINIPRARSLLEAHQLLLRAARRHELIPGNAAARADSELRRLTSELEALARGAQAP